MRINFILVIFSVVTFNLNSAFAEEPSPLAEVRRHSANEEAIREDFKRILREAKLSEDFITFNRSDRKRFVQRGSLSESIVKIYEKNSSGVRSLVIDVDAPDNEWAFAAYYGLQKMGFLFPHPRIQISPALSRIENAVGRTFTWRPRYQYRGFHYHTQHPSEFHQGFLMGKKDAARDSIRWLARNGQNIGQVVLLENKFERIVANLSDLVDYSHQMGVSFGVNAFFNFMQQNAYRLIGTNNKFRSLGLLPGDSKKAIRKGIDKLQKGIDFDFMTFDIGSSEFTSTDYQKTIDWMNTADDELSKTGRRIFIKVHSSHGQEDPKFGNFNFVPQYANKTVGVLPHTVMFYSLTDDPAPVYGRKDFKDTTEFMVKQAKLRPTWYYPETSYFIAMDIDMPLLLTDYLIARSSDMDLIEKAGVQGQINFTTGQELGYWLKDWTVALLANSEYRGNPMIALDLMGESRKVWESILAYQHRFFKKNLLMEELSSANVSDELDIGMITHERTIFRKLKKNPELLNSRIALLREAVANTPSTEGVKNDELRSLLDITFMRVNHALQLRLALLEESGKRRKSSVWVGSLGAAKDLRMRGIQIMNHVRANYDRYPEANTFVRHENLSSYAYGYGWPASKLHFWEREEMMIYKNSYSPFFMNIFAIGRIIL